MEEKIFRISYENL